MKQCSCGLIHTEIPLSAKIHASGDELAGAYFDCVCGSTIFIPYADMGPFIRKLEERMSA